MNKTENCVLWFIFDPPLENVLLVSKENDTYDGLYAMLSVNLPLGEKRHETALRALYEETHEIEGTGETIELLISEILRINVFYGVLKNEIIPFYLQQNNVKWVKLEHTLFDVRNEKLAGIGELSFLLHATIQKIKKEMRST